MNRLLVAQVREMVERHWSASEIAAKMGVDLATVVEIVKMLANQLT